MRICKCQKCCHALSTYQNTSRSSYVLKLTEDHRLWRAESVSRLLRPSSYHHRPSVLPARHLSRPHDCAPQMTHHLSSRARCARNCDLRRRVEASATRADHLAYRAKILHRERCPVQVQNRGAVSPLRQGSTLTARGRPSRAKERRPRISRAAKVVGDYSTRGRRGRRRRGDS